MDLALEMSKIMLKAYAFAMVHIGDGDCLGVMARDMKKEIDDMLPGFQDKFEKWEDDRYDC